MTCSSPGNLAAPGWASGIRDVLLARTGSRRPPPDPMTDALLFNAARRQLVERGDPAGLDAGTTVLCARFADSTMAYQGFGAGVPLDRLAASSRSPPTASRPDLTILLDVPPRSGWRASRPAK